MSASGNVRVGCLGSGIMGGLLVERLVRAKVVEATSVIACDPDEARLQELADRLGVQVSTDNRDGADADVVLVAVPPPAVVPVLQEIADVLSPGALVVSVAAGVTLEKMSAVLPEGSQVVRVMPNTPSLMGQGINVFACNDAVTPAGRTLLQQLLDAWGDSFEIAEEVMNAACALLAVGPTYLFPIADTLIRAASDAGLEGAQARHIAGRLFEGVGIMLLESERDVDELKNMISLQTLDEAGAAELFRSAYEEALSKLSALQEKLSS